MGRLQAEEGLLRLLAALPGEENCVDVGENSTLGDGDSCQQLVELLVVADGQLKVAGIDPLLLVVTGSVSGQLKDLSGQVLHDRGHVDGGSRSYSLGVVSLAEETVNATDWELEPSSARSTLGLGAALATFTTSRHNEVFRELLAVN